MLLFSPRLPPAARIAGILRPAAPHQSGQLSVACFSLYMAPSAGSGGLGRFCRGTIDPAHHALREVGSCCMWYTM
jgi:hypothetical protein